MNAELIDVVVPRDHAETKKVAGNNPWQTIKPDEQTVPQTSRHVEGEHTTCAELIRLITTTYEIKRP